MGRFFFHLYDGLCRQDDPVGTQVDSHDAAIARARMLARGIMAADIESGSLRLDARFDVEHGCTGEVYRVEFRDAVRISDGPGDPATARRSSD